VVTTSPLPHNATKTQGSCPQRSFGTFARLIGSAFAFSQVNPLRECYLRTHKMLRGHTRIFARAYYPRLNNVSNVAVGRTMCHAGIKSARPSIASSSESQWELTLIELSCPYYLDMNRRSRSDGRKLSIPSTSRTLATKHGEHRQTYWQVWTLLSPVPCLGKLHRVTTHEERSTQDWGSRVHQARQQPAVRPVKDSYT